MLSTLTREDESWDVAVQKAILSFICTLVYRPIDDREHPDQPVLASSVISTNVIMPALDSFGAPALDNQNSIQKVSLGLILFCHHCEIACRILLLGHE